MTDESKSLMERRGDEMVVEIVELESGEVALRTTGLADGGQVEPLMTVTISEPLRERMKDKYVDIARVMLTAGVQLIAEAGYMSESEDIDQFSEEKVEPVLH